LLSAGGASLFFDKTFAILKEYYPLLLQGAVTTVQIAILSTIIGFVIGLMIGVVKTIPMPQKGRTPRKLLQKFINFLLSVYIEVFRGTPMMIQAVMIFYGYSYITGRKLAPMLAAFIIVSINTGAYMAEVVRGGIESIDRGQFEGAHAIGMSHTQTMLKVILPQTVRNILPATGNEFIINLKDTSVLNVISITELFFQTKTVATTTFAAFPTYTIAAVLYLILTFTTSRLLRLVEKKMGTRGSYKLNTTRRSRLMEQETGEAKEVAV
jgi:putative lysine transport system permease protein